MLGLAWLARWPHGAARHVAHGGILSRLEEPQDAEHHSLTKVVESVRSEMHRVTGTSLQERLDTIVDTTRQLARLVAELPPEQQGDAQRPPALQRAKLDEVIAPKLPMLMVNEYPALVRKALAEWRNPELLFRYLDANRHDEAMASLIKRWLRAMFGLSTETQRMIRRESENRSPCKNPPPAAVMRHGPPNRPPKSRQPRIRLPSRPLMLPLPLPVLTPVNPIAQS